MGLQATIIHFKLWYTSYLFKRLLFLSINIRQVDRYHGFKWQILKDLESKNKNVSMQIIHLSKVNKTDQDLYFYVDKDQSVDRDFILEREGGGGETREREREMIKRER